MQWERGELKFGIVLTKLNRRIVIYSTRKTLAWELKLKTKYYFFEDLKNLTKGKVFTKL